MLRLRVAGMLVMAVVLLAAACGEDDAIVSDPSPDTGAPTTVAAPDESPATSDTAETDVAEPSDPDDATGADSEDAGDGGSMEDGEDAAPVDAETLLASATTELDGRSVRGEASIELAPGFGLSTSFESDADGDLVALVEIPPGLDPEFPGGADAEVRYVGDVVYIRPPVHAETLEELGLDEAWYAAEPAPGGDPMSDAMGSAGGVICVFPQMQDVPSSDCDLLGETGAFLEAADEATVIGREDVRGVEATGVRFLVSLLDLAGEGLGLEPRDDGETSEGGAFDDTASDPFAEGVDQILGFLDADFEVEVWIDDEGLIRRLSFDLASLFAGLVGADAAAEMPSSLITLEFYDFDADISIEAPPPEVIVDEDLLVGGDDYAFEDDYEPEYDDDYDDDDYDDDY